jgi:hypothetical protein
MMPDAARASALSMARTAPRALVVGGRRFLGALIADLPQSVRRQMSVLALILVYWISGLVVGDIAGLPSAATITTYLPTYMAAMPMMIVALLIGRGLVIMIADRPARPLTQLAHEIRTSLATPQRIAHAVPILAGMLVFGGTFTVMKASIPSLAPFAWDVPFEQLDRWLHGGIAPWEFLQPIFGVPLVTHAINWAYSLWFYCLGLIWVWQAFSQRDDKLRLQFFLTLILGWSLLGNIAATWFSSAGPCYFGRVTGLADPFAPLMSYLHEVNQSHAIWAVDAQEVLWHNYSLREVALGSGISAMPSMHVAMATLFALACWRTKRWLGIAMTIYAIVIMIGSVHLGWHYAVDGYAGALGMLLIWWVVGRALGRKDTARSMAAAINPAQ